MRTTLLAACLALTAAGPALAADPVEGEWLTAAGNGKVRIGPCPADARQLCGVVSWLKNPAAAKARDTKNFDPALRSRPLMGMPVLMGFARAGQGRWTGGKVYDAISGKTYDGALSAQPDGTLKVNVCALKVACRAQVWTRG